MRVPVLFLLMPPSILFMLRLFIDFMVGGWGISSFAWSILFRTMVGVTLARPDAGQSCVVGVAKGPVFATGRGLRTKKRRAQMLSRGKGGRWRDAETTTDNTEMQMRRDYGTRG